MNLIGTMSIGVQGPIIKKGDDLDDRIKEIPKPEDLRDGV